MKTAYYTFTTWSAGAMAAGFDGTASGSRQRALVRQPEQEAGRQAEGAVIDLNAWRAANLEWLQEEPLDGVDEDVEDWAGEEPAEPVLPEPRPRRDHRRALLAAELVSTLAVAGTAVALMLRVLMF